MRRKTYVALVIASKFAAIYFAIGAGEVNAQPTRLPNQGAEKLKKQDGRGVSWSYQASSHTRVFVTTRSWLDGGTEVSPGERKFSDYALPPGYSFATENNNRSTARQPLNSSWDIGAYLMALPIN